MVKLKTLRTAIDNLNLDVEIPRLQRNIAILQERIKQHEIELKWCLDLEKMEVFMALDELKGEQWFKDMQAAVL